MHLHAKGWVEEDLEHSSPVGELWLFWALVAGSWVLVARTLSGVRQTVESVTVKLLRGSVWR